MAVLFARFKVADLERFRRVHAKAGAVHGNFGLIEAVWQSVDDPLSLTIAIRGGTKEIEAWLRSPERTELSRELEVESIGESWLTDEMFPEGEYGI